MCPYRCSNGSTGERRIGRLLPPRAGRRNEYDDASARISGSEGRILLTRDRGLLKRSCVTHGDCVRDTHPPRQVVEVVRRFDLLRSIVPFQWTQATGRLDPNRFDATRSIANASLSVGRLSGKPVNYGDGRASHRRSLAC